MRKLVVHHRRGLGNPLGLSRHNFKHMRGAWGDGGGGGCSYRRLGGGGAGGKRAGERGGSRAGGDGERGEGEGKFIIRCKLFSLCFF